MTWEKHLRLSNSINLNPSFNDPVKRHRKLSENLNQNQDKIPGNFQPRVKSLASNSNSNPNPNRSRISAAETGTSCGKILVQRRGQGDQLTSEITDRSCSSSISSNVHSSARPVFSNNHKSLLTSCSGGLLLTSGGETRNRNQNQKQSLNSVGKISTDPSNPNQGQGEGNVPTLKKTILNALQQSVFGRPLALGDIVDYSRHFHFVPQSQSEPYPNQPPINPPSIDQLVYNELSELCTEKCVVKMIGGKGGGSITYCLSEWSRASEGIPVTSKFSNFNSTSRLGTSEKNPSNSKIDLKFQGSLTHESHTNNKNSNKNSNQKTEAESEEMNDLEESINKNAKSWLTLRSRLYINPKDFQNGGIFSASKIENGTESMAEKGKDNISDLGLGIGLRMRMTDSMLYESFGSRVGLPRLAEGLQRPNTPENTEIETEIEIENNLGQISSSNSWIFNRHLQMQTQINDKNESWRKIKDGAEKSSSDEKFMSSLLLNRGDFNIENPAPNYEQNDNNDDESEEMKEKNRLRLAMLRRINEKLKLIHGFPEKQNYHENNNNNIKNNINFSHDLKISSTSHDNDSDKKQNLSFLQEITDILETYEQKVGKSQSNSKIISNPNFDPI